MGCGSSTAASAAPSTTRPNNDANTLLALCGLQVAVSNGTVWPIPSQPLSLDELHPKMKKVHHASFNNEERQAPMRLIKTSAICNWQELRVYEDIRSEDYLEIPYEDVTEEIWRQAVVLSWRWSGQKPAQLEPSFSPMSMLQLQYLQGFLKEEQDQIEWAWIDWCCAPQVMGYITAYACSISGAIAHIGW